MFRPIKKVAALMVIAMIVLSIGGLGYVIRQGSQRESIAARTLRDIHCALVGRQGPIGSFTLELTGKPLNPVKDCGPLLKVTSGTLDLLKAQNAEELKKIQILLERPASVKVVEKNGQTIVVTRYLPSPQSSPTSSPKAKSSADPNPSPSSSSNPRPSCNLIQQLTNSCK